MRKEGGGGGGGGGNGTLGAVATPTITAGGGSAAAAGGEHIRDFAERNCGRQRLGQALPQHPGRQRWGVRRGLLTTP